MSNNQIQRPQNISGPQNNNNQIQRPQNISGQQNINNQFQMLQNTEDFTATQQHIDLINGSTRIQDVENRTQQSTQFSTTLHA
ncbi:4088_t:CDS:2 [Gigaspora margarita]|uniref:4088_t:CDS:1 n=1 Tax=Gigaspora margarita TaxID=4874 RepID=A0ABN7UW28_GIGMA|nr:4088_t:CDS:2 [Gigaspora margarita]